MFQGVPTDFPSGITTGLLPEATSETASCFFYMNSSRKFSAFSAIFRSIFNSYYMIPLVPSMIHSFRYSSSNLLCKSWNKFWKHLWKNTLKIFWRNLLKNPMRYFWRNRKSNFKNNLCRYFHRNLQRNFSMYSCIPIL